ncbi:glycosyltransferase [Marinobacter sp.]|uniref:glycosyltransferase n=1 Tax=Marinobacter sp. TaxID=50741 RepID=UPI00384F087C
MEKIFFVLPNLNSGGAERVAVNYLRQLDPEKHIVTLAVFQKSNDLLPLIPAYVQLINLQTESTSRSFWPLLNLLWQIKPDVIFTTHSRVATLLMLIRPFAPKFRHLARMQSTPSLEKKHAAYGWLKRKLYSFGYRSADIVIAQTEAMKHDGVEQFGLNPSRVKELSNPIDTRFIDKSVDGMRSPFVGDKIFAVASGRLSFEKGFDVLISALPSVLVEYPNFALYILGNDVGEKEKLKKLVNKLGLEDYVEFLGFQSNPYCYYAFCDLFILSSRWEGFPNALLENYYLNTPIVSTECVPIVKELVKDGVNGYVCNVEDKACLSKKITECLNNIKRYQVKNRKYDGSMLEVLF